MIDDGFTYEATIAGLDNIEPYVFTYRPVMWRERRQAVLIAKASGQVDEIDRLIRRHVQQSPIPLPVMESCLHQLWARVRDVVCGEAMPTAGQGCVGWEEETASRLESGLRVEVLHPTFGSWKSCDHCKKWWYNDETGRVIRDGRQNMVRRPEGSLLLCETSEGCPNGTPDKSLRLTPQLVRTVEHWQEHLATMTYPDDPIVRRNATIISRTLLKLGINGQALRLTSISRPG